MHNPTMKPVVVAAPHKLSRKTWHQQHGTILSIYCRPEPKHDRWERTTAVLSADVACAESYSVCWIICWISPVEKIATVAAQSVKVYFPLVGQPKISIEVQQNPSNVTLWHVYWLLQTFSQMHPAKLEASYATMEPLAYPSYHRPSAKDGFRTYLLHPRIKHYVLQ